MSLILVRFIDVTPRFANFQTEMINLLTRLEFILAPSNPPQIDPLVFASIEKYLQAVEFDASDLELESTTKRLSRLRTYLESVKRGIASDSRIIDEIRVLREAYIDDLKERYVFVPDADKAPNIRWGQKELFGAKVYANFPTARDDIRAAGNCYATDNSTACVVHLMRAAERAMRVLARRLKVSFSYPLEYAEWGTVIGKMLFQLEARQKKAQAAKRGPKKDAELRFYSGAIHQCNFLNDFWRVEAAHARKQYNSREALNVLNHVRDFMQTLAERLKE